MRVSAFLALATVTLFFSTAAIAFTTDDKTMTNADGSAKLSDPDEQTPSGSGFIPPSNFNQQATVTTGQGSTGSAATFSPANQVPPRH